MDREEKFVDQLIWRLAELVLFDFVFEFPLSIAATLQCLHGRQASLLWLKGLDLYICEEALCVGDAPSCRLR